MQFSLQPFDTIKGNIDELIKDHTVHTLQSSNDLKAILSSGIKVYNAYRKEHWTWKFILTYEKEHIWTCKYIVNHEEKTYMVSRIWLRENLQRNWIWTEFYKSVLIPFMSVKAAGYTLKKAPEQRPWWEWIHRKLDS